MNKDALLFSQRGYVVLTTCGIKKFILNGYYAQMKYEEEKQRKLKETIREDQTRLNKKRMVWRESGVVGEFTNFMQYNYKHLELNEMLYHLGILPLIASIETKALTENEVVKLRSVQIPGKRYVRYAPNKEYTKVKYEESDFTKTPLKEKVVQWKEAYTRFGFLSENWEKERATATHSEAFRISKQLHFEFGTISLLGTPVTYDAEDILQLLGGETLIKCAKVNTDKLPEYAAKGFFNMSDIKKFREVSGVCERYTLMTLQNENTRRNFWYGRLNNLSQLSQNSMHFDSLIAYQRIVDEGKGIMEHYIH